jgi:hypothetical protein
MSTHLSGMLPENGTRVHNWTVIRINLIATIIDADFKLWDQLVHTSLCTRPGSSEDLLRASERTHTVRISPSSPYSGKLLASCKCTPDDLKHATRRAMTGYRAARASPVMGWPCPEHSMQLFALRRRDGPRFSARPSSLGREARSLYANGERDQQRVTSPRDDTQGKWKK